MALAELPSAYPIDFWCGVNASTATFKATNAWYLRMLDFCYVVLRPFLVFDNITHRVYNIRQHVLRCSFRNGKLRRYFLTGPDTKHNRRELVSQILWDHGYFNHQDLAKIHQLVRACQPPAGKAVHVLRHFLRAFQIDVTRLATEDRVKILSGVCELTNSRLNEELVNVFNNYTYTNTNATIA